MIFLFCSVYSTCRCPFFLQSYCPGEWSSTAMLTGRGLNDSFPQIKDLGYFINSSVMFSCLIALIPQSFDARKISSRQEEPKGFKRREKNKLNK